MSQPPVSFTVAYAADGTATSPEFTPWRGHTCVSAYVKPEDAGTAKLQRKDSSGTWADITDATAVSAGAELPIFLGGPTTTIRVSYTNTDTSAGTYRVEFVQGGTR